MKNIKGGTIFAIAAAVLLLIFGKKIFDIFGDSQVFKQDDNTKANDSSKSADKAVVVDTQKLKNPPVFYQNVAESLFQAMEDATLFTFLSDTTLLFSSLKGLNNEELKQVYKFFGTREASVFGVTMWEGNLNNWFNKVLSGDDLTRMKQLWSGTGIFNTK